MREQGIGDLEWVDREGWRKKINLPLAQKKCIHAYEGSRSPNARALY